MNATNTLILGLGAALASSAPALAQTRVYDNITGSGGIGTINPYYAPSNTVLTGNTAGTGNRYVGQALNLAGSGPQAISGFDIVLGNGSGSAIAAGTQLRLSYWVWGSWNNAATGTSSVFSNLLGTGSLYYTVGTTLNNGASRVIQGATPGTTPGFSIDPIALPVEHSTIGMSFAWQKLVGDQWTWVNGITSGTTGGSNPAPSAIAPVVGSMPSGPLSFYYRSNDMNGGDTEGQFQAASAKNFGTSNSGMMLRVYAVPTPAAGGVLAAAGLLATRRRRK